MGKRFVTQQLSRHRLRHRHCHPMVYRHFSVEDESYRMVPLVRRWKVACWCRSAFRWSKCRRREPWRVTKEKVPLRRFQFHEGSPQETWRSWLSTTCGFWCFPGYRVHLAWWEELLWCPGWTSGSCFQCLRRWRTTYHCRRYHRGSLTSQWGKPLLLLRGLSVCVFWLELINSSYFLLNSILLLDWYIDQYLI